LSLVAIRDLLGEGFDEYAAALPSPQRRALAVALLREEAGASGPSEGALAAGCLAAVRELARPRPLVIALDDVQWLDGPSVGLLEFVVRRLRDEQIAWLLARRIEGETWAPLGLERVFPPERLHKVRPSRLSLGALHQLLRIHLGGSFPRPLLRRLHASSGGNPLFALELARALRARAGELGPEHDLPVPGTLEELVWDRLAGLPGETTDVLFVLSAVPDATVDLVARAVRRDPWAGLGPAVDRHVVELVGERVRFVHPLFADVVHGLTGAERRRELNRRLAELVDDVEARARLIALSTDGPDASAGRMLDDAAELALARGAPAAAAELLEHARRLTAADELEAWARRTVDAAEAHAGAGDARRGRRLLEEVVDRAPAGPVRARALVELAWWSSSVELCERAAAEAGDDAKLCARIDYIRAFVHSLRGDYHPALAAARAAVRSAEAAGDATLVVLSNSLLGFVEAAAGVASAEVHLEHALRHQEAAGRVRVYSAPRTVLGRRAMWHDDLDRARELFEGQRRVAAEFGDEESTALLCVHLTELEWRAGRWDRAAAYADELAAFGEQEDEQDTDPVTHYAQALIAAYRGEVDSARSLAEGGLAAGDAVGWKLWSGKNRAVLGFVELSCGDPAAAVRWLSPLAAQADEMGVGDPSVFLATADEIESLVALGRLDEAEERLSAFDRRGHELDRPWILCTAARCRGLLLATRGELAEAIACLEHAVATHERLPMPFEHGRTMLALGTTKRRLKQRRAAREALEEALRIFEELEAPLWADRARAELARIGGRMPARGELTATERRVAELAAEGRSNKEIARELFVTVKTVEANLSRVYAKLGIRSRAELARRVPPKL
jgi:DNA-binding CsgD family transcriptional regulator